jgi:hypothetical protein
MISAILATFFPFYRSYFYLALHIVGYHSHCAVSVSTEKRGDLRIYDEKNVWIPDNRNRPAQGVSVRKQTPIKKLFHDKKNFLYRYCKETPLQRKK